MPAFPSLAPSSTWNVLARCAGILLGALGGISGTAAQDWPTAKITAEDLRRALIWTGHYSAFEDGDSNDLVRVAGQAWQKSKSYAVTKTLSDDQVGDLIADGQKQRDAVGWATLEDKSMGFSIGVPTRLVKFLGAHSTSLAQTYQFEGVVGYTLVVRYGDFNCMTIGAWYRKLQKANPFFSAQRGDWMAFGEQDSTSRTYERAVCRGSGMVVASITIPNTLLPTRGNLFAAMGESLVLGRGFNPTAVPHPKLDAPPPLAGDFMTVSSEHAVPKAKAPPDNADKDGKTDTIKRATRDGKELSVEEIFRKVSPAVYVVKADSRLGSSVAISDYELLTNCHVVADLRRVTIARDKKQAAAEVISVNSDADRCVLKSDAKLDTWVTVRAYEDIKVGERAVTIGTPQGLELTVAEGIVSSKRSHNNARLIQTTAPISQGSSGGGLFDAEGHLLGITTFFLRSGQNLNFAVAAEEFAK